MKIAEFTEQTSIIAKNQPEYLSLPAYRFPDDPKGELVCCWKLSWKERLVVLFTGRIWHHILTFNKPLQPQKIEAVKPVMPKYQ